MSAKEERRREKASTSATENLSSSPQPLGMTGNDGARASSSATDRTNGDTVAAISGEMEAPRREEINSETEGATSSPLANWKRSLIDCKETMAYGACYKHSMYYITRVVMDIAIIWWVITKE